MVPGTVAQGVDSATEAADRLALIRRLARTGFPGRVQTMALDLYARAERHGDKDVAAASADQIAWCSMLTSEYEQGIRYGRIARSAWAACGATAEHATTLGLLALLLAFLGEPDAVGEAEEALTLAGRAGDPAAIVWTLHAKCSACVQLKHPHLGLAFGERAVALCRQQPEPSIWPFLSLSDAVICCCLQDEGGAHADSPALQAAVARAIACTREGLALAWHQGDGWLQRLLLNNVAEYSLYLGDTHTADAALAQFDDTAGEPTNRCRVTHLLMRGRSLAARHLHEDALHSFQAAASLVVQGDLELASMCQSDLSDAYASLGRFEPALAAHRAYHAVYVRRASEAAERRARIYQLQWETETLRKTAARAQAQLCDLAASQEQLSQEAQRLLRASMEDPLTGLANRRRLQTAFLELLATPEPYCLAMVDVDRFKQINDGFSHEVGDRLLRQLGALLTKGIREQDLAARYGGEEFSLLLRGTQAGTARTICERLRRAVERFDWSAVQPGLAVTISIGLAMSGPSAPPDQILALADRRLYVAKRSGRNRLVDEGG